MCYGHAMTPESHRHDLPHWPRALWLAVGFAGVAALAALVLTVAADGPIPTNDGPQHVFRAMTSARLAAEDPEASRLWFETPTRSSHGPSELLPLLFRWMPPDRAENVMLVLFASAFMAAVCGLLGASPQARGRRLIFAPLGAALAVHWALYIGLIPFYLSTSLAIFAIALWIRADERKPLHVMILGVGCFGISFFHILGALFALMASGIITLARAPRSALRVVIAGTPTILFLLSTTSTVPGAESGAWQWLPLSERWMQAATHLLPGPLWKSGLPFVVLVAGGVAGMASRVTLDRALSLCAIGLWLVSMALPWSGPWQLVSPRSLPLAVACACAALPVERLSPRHAFLVLSVIVGWTAAALSWSAQFHERLSRYHRVAERIIEAGPSSAVVRAPLLLSPSPRFGVPGLDPLFHFGQRVAVSWGGYSHFTQHGWVASGHALQLHEDVEAALPAAPSHAVIQAARAMREGSERRDTVRELVRAASASDELMIIGTEDDIATALELGVAARARGPGWLVGAVARCPTRVEVTGLEGPTRVEIGLAKDHASFVFEVEPSVEGHREMTALWPCLPMWIRSPLGCSGTGSGAAMDLRDAGGERVLHCALGSERSLRIQE